MPKVSQRKRDFRDGAGSSPNERFNQHPGRGTNTVPEPDNDRKNCKRDPAQCSDTIHNVSIQLTDKIYAQIWIREDMAGLFLKEFAHLVCAHPDYREMDWNKDTPILMVLRHVLLEFERLKPADLELYFEIDGEKVRPMWVYECAKSYQYGNLVPCEWLVDLRKKNRKAYLLSMEFFSFTLKYLYLGLWDGYYEEMELEHLVETVEYHRVHKDTDLSDEELEEYQCTIRYYSNVVNSYADRIRNHDCRPMELQEKLNQYKPRKEKYKALKNWMLEGIQFYHQGVNFHDFFLPQQIAENYFRNSEIHPYDYCHFIWSDTDFLGSGLESQISYEGSNLGLIPLVETRYVNQHNIEHAKKLFGISDQFCDWMSFGSQMARKLIDR